MTATDPDGLSAQQAFSVTVANRAPQPVDTIPALELAPGDSATIDLAAYFSDPDGDTLSYAAETSDSAVAAVSVSGTVLKIVAESAGTADVSVTATDPGGLSAQQAFSVTVANRAPQPVDTIPALELAPGDSATIDLAAYFSDPDGDTLSYAAETSDSAVAAVSVSGTVLKIVAESAGTADVSVTATDPGGLSAQQAFSVTVANRAPQPVDAIPALELATGDSTTVDLATYFSDPDGDTLSYAAETSDSAVAAVSVSGTVLKVLAESAGTADVTVTATDPGGLSAQQAFSVTAANRAPQPVDAIPALELAAGDSATVDLATYFSDPDGDALSYAAETSDSAVAAVSVSGTVLKVLAESAGTADVTVTATDPGGLSAQQAFSVTVSSPPPPPPGFSVELRIEPSQGQNDAFRVLADPTFFADQFDLDVFIITGDDAATWEFTNDQPITAGEGRVELADLNFGTTPQSLDDVTRAKVVFDENFDTTHVLLCTILAGGSSQRVEATCLPAPPSPPPPPTFDGSVDLRIEPSQSQNDAFRVLADPTFFADQFDLDVFIITGDDAATWEFTNDQPITAGEGRVELADLNFGTTPQSLDDVTRAKVVFDENFDTTHVLLCTILAGRSPQRVEATCLPAPPPPPPPPTFDGSVDLRIEPSQSQNDAFRVLADPTFFADQFDLDVFIITGDDAATWEFTNDQPITAGEGRVELADLNFGTTPQSLDDVTRAKVVFDENFDTTHVLLCTILAGGSSQRVEATCLPAPPPPPPPPTFDGSVDLRIEPSQSQNDAFRVLADPTFFADQFDLDVFIITGDDAATWEFTNDQPITAGEGRVELADLNFGTTPQSLDDVTRAKVVFDENFDTTHVLLCTILAGRSPQRVEATCLPAPPPPPPSPTFDGSVDLRIEPSQSQNDAFRVLADPTFFADQFDLDVFIITGDDAATWEFTNDQPITAGEGRVELADLNFGTTPQSLDDVTRVRVVYSENFTTTHTLLCSISEERSSQRIEVNCSTS